MSLIAPILATLWLLIVSGSLGMIQIRRRIEAHEARHELRTGSASQIRRIISWTAFALWLMATWYFATIIGDWAVSGDLGGAVERSLLRLRILMEIAVALGDSG